MRPLLLLALAALVSLTGMVPAGATLPPGGSFIDDDGSFAEPSIEAIAAAGITEGCGSEQYCPGRPVTRAETAALIQRALGLEPAPARFPDVREDAWYAPAVGAASEAGVLEGYREGEFGPERPISRAELAAVLVRAFDITPVEQPPRFEDVPEDAWFAGDVEGLAQEGMTNGCSITPRLFCPTDAVTRAEMAVFLTRGLGLTPMRPPQRIAPLDGRPVDGIHASRRVVAVKIDNHPGARPQSGVEDADAVVELLVEYGLTRWMALFHQSDSDYVGPIRSARPVDTGVLLPLDATLLVSGGQPWILDEMRAEGVHLIRERMASPPALFRIDSRRAPHNVYGQTPAMRELATSLGYPDAPPPPLFSWGALPSGSRAERVVLSWSDPVSVEWTWDGARYLRSMGGEPHMTLHPDGSADQVAADTLVVIVAPVYQAAPPPGVCCSSVPALDTTGEGRLLVFSGGQVVEGTWSRETEAEWFTFTGAEGTPLSVPPGTPWISVFPDGRPISTG